jgi:hypothetical protein
MAHRQLKRDTDFPDGFWEWDPDKQEQWFTKWFEEICTRERRRKLNTASQERLKLVCPDFADIVNTLYAQCAAENIFLTVAQGLRTWKDQDGLWLKGRDAEGNVINKAQVVTNARGGESWHNFGLAVDCYPENVAGMIDWNPAHPQWKRMEVIGVSLGLTSGANWIRLVDAPHFQLTGRFPVGAPDDEVRELYKSGGLAAVWAAVLASVKSA